MPHDETGRPALTRTGLKNLSAQLDADLAAVESSGAATQLKNEIRTLIASVKGVLDHAANHDTDDAAGTWVDVLAPSYETLTGKLAQALALGDGDIGACFYTNPEGCITSTAAQCDTLGGAFHPGERCPPA